MTKPIYLVYSIAVVCGSVGILTGVFMEMVGNETGLLVTMTSYFVSMVLIMTGIMLALLKFLYEMSK